MPSYREVGMFQIKEVLRLWLAGVSKQRIAALAQVDRKTVRRSIALFATRAEASRELFEFIEIWLDFPDFVDTWVS
jgi:hypothetical protein